MPTKKQRRRQQKARRHEYEYVYVDDEGNEVAVDPAELRTEKNGTKSEGGARRSDDRKAVARKGSQRRPIEPPSWRRSFRRALILGPILIIALMLLNQNVPFEQQIAPAIVMVAFFIPFSYFTDSLAYRMYRKRVERRDTAKTR
jgi:hypothetical protein